MPKRGKLFTKLTKEVIVSARMGGGQPGRQRAFAPGDTRCRDASMPKDNIERAIKKERASSKARPSKSMFMKDTARGGSRHSGRSRDR